MVADRDSVAEAFDVLDAAMSGLCELSFDALTTPERLNYLERLEAVARQVPVPGHALINQLAEQAGEEELGNRLSRALADRLRITRGEAARRVAEAADLGERRALTGEALPPLLTATATAQRTGRIGGEHVQVIRQFYSGCRPASTLRPGRRPKPTWPGWPPGFGPTSWTSWPTG